MIEEIFEKLNERQALFVTEYVRTAKPKESALLAGFSPLNAAQSGWQLLRNSKVKEAVDKLREEQDKIMLAQLKSGAQRAFNTLMQIIENPEMNPQARVAAAKDVMDRAGYRPALKTENTLEVTYSDTAESLQSKLLDSFASLDEQRAEITDITITDGEREDVSSEFVGTESP